MNQLHTLVFIEPTVDNWCDSIKGDINQFDHGITKYLKEPTYADCHGSPHPVSIERLTYINSQIQNDVNFAYKAYALWKAHPDIKEYCCLDVSNDYVKIVQKMVTFGDDFFRDLHTLTASKFREEVEKICLTMKQEPFCDLQYALTIVDIAAELPYKRSRWTEDDIDKSDVILIHVVVLVREHPAVYGSLRSVVPAEEEKRVIMKAVNRILQYIQGGDLTRLRQLHKQLPRMHSFTLTGATCHADKLCILMKIIAQLDSYIEQLNMYENSLLFNGRRRVLLNTGIDYTEFLKQKQLDRILQVLDEQHVTSLSIATALKGHITGKFSELKSYYQQVESFNGDIAKADVGYILGRLDMFKERIATVVDKFRSKMSDLIIQMMIGAGVELANAVVTMALAIADACNPLGLLFGGADPVDLQDAIAGVARATGLIAQSSAVTDAWNKVKTQSIEINNKFKKNRLFLEKVKELVYEESNSRKEFEQAKNTFLEQYNAYDPQVVPDDLVKMTALWSGLAESGCEVINSFETPAGLAVAAVVKGMLLCTDLPILARRMGGLYENIYDFQFDLVDALVEYMRAKVTVDAANEITTELTSISNKNLNDETTLDTLQMMGGLTFTTFKTHLLQAFNHYCNILQYTEGDKRPIQCKGPNTDISLLISKTITECAEETFRFYQVPTTPSGPDDKAYVDLSELFKGATVDFKIPNSQWLVDNDWINKIEMNNTFLVEKMEVYLPTTPSRPANFIVTADPILKNQIIPSTNGTEYMIVPHVPLSSEYVMGQRRTPCRLGKLPNPYTSCDPEETSNVCPSTLDGFRVLYPSLYSQWAITIHKNEHLTPPRSATDMFVYFGVKLCKIVPGNHNEFQAGVVHSQEVSDCCPSGQYRPNITAECTDCPGNSHPALAGHYCVKD